MKKLLYIKDLKGFTLVELMVVVTIIAFLAIIGIASFTTVQKNARDGRRRADIQAIATALESNRTAAGKYPAVDCTSTTIFASGKCPTDPDSTKSYTGIPIAESDTFNVCATLEVPAAQQFCRSNQQ